MRTLLNDYEHEVFVVVLLYTEHRIIGFHELFRGTVDAASVYPHEVVKLALKQNVSAMILTHKHPSGKPDPSHADISITQRLVV